MYFPYLRGRQFELIALRELVEKGIINDKIIPVIEPIKPSTTFLKTLNAYEKAGKKIIVLQNPEVGNFKEELRAKQKSDSTKENVLRLGVEENESVIQGYFLKDEIKAFLKKDPNKLDYLVINQDRDEFAVFQEIYNQTETPKYVLVPDDRFLTRKIPNNKILLKDPFIKQVRNIDYAKKEDEFFSDDHLYFKEENFMGFSDYSIVGKEYSESGFAPIAVAIHIVYFDEEDNLRVHHFVSDSNEDIHDPAGKFGEALNKLVEWCDRKDIQKTVGLQYFYDCHNTGIYPGLGSVKKYSIMHHLELMSTYLGGGIHS